MLIDFCLPVRNEEKIIEQNTLKLFNYLKDIKFNFDWRIVIVNNGSTDATKEKALQLVSDKILYFEVELPGRGRALKKYWLSSDSDVLVYMDMDLAVSLNNIPDLVDPIIRGDYDLVMGSRRLLSAKCQRSFFRDLISRTYLFLSRRILQHNFTDLQCGFKAVRASRFKEIAKYLADTQWFFDTEMVIVLHKFGGKIKEIPVDWKDNRYLARKSRVLVVRDGILFFKNLFKLRKRAGVIKKG
jgi:glycosyltransferase involved in cell wall biosynthesis